MSRRRIRTTRGARRARTYALVLAAWRRDVLRGSRIGRSAEGVDLPRRYRLNAGWVYVHLFLWDEDRQVKAFRSELDSTGPIDLLRGTHD